MQRFELVAGASAKFWEIERAGVTVTVTFGRIGTAGQSQVKGFGSAAAAEVHEAKLIADKTKKGYRPVSSIVLVPPRVAEEAVEEPENEDTLVLPGAWRSVAWVRRDRGAVDVAVEPLPAGRELELLRLHAVDVRRRLHNAPTEPDVREAGLAYLDARLDNSDGQADPFGAAVCLEALGMSVPYRDHHQLVPVADDWVGRFGLTFAVSAVAQVSGLRLTGLSSNRRDEVGVVRVGKAGYPLAYVPHWFGVAVRLRAILATAVNRDEAVDTLATFRTGWLPCHRAVASFLVPDRLEWVEEDTDVTTTDFLVARLRGGAAHTGAQVRAVAVAGRLAESVHDLPLLATLMIGVGPGIAPVLHDWLDEPWHTADSVRRLLAALALVPSDEAFLMLLERADEKYTHAPLMDAIRRFPIRALRLLALAPMIDRTAAALTRVHVLSDPERARRAQTALPPAAAARITEILDSTAALAYAPADAVPPILADPPWERSRTRAKPVVISGVAATAEAAMAWKPGEREAFQAYNREIDTLSLKQTSWEEQAALEWDGSTNTGWRDIPILVHAPDEVTLRRLPGWVPQRTWDLAPVAFALAGRYEIAVLPNLLMMPPAMVFPALMPYANSAVAVLAAGSLARLKSVRATAVAWLNRHPEVAARALVPAAVGRAGAARSQAERALRLVAAAGHRGAVATAAAGYGTHVSDAISTLLDSDPVDAVPAKVPTVPDWLDPSLLPPVQLVNGAGVLPGAAVRNLCTVFALSTIAEPYAGVARVAEACEPGALAGFWWEAFLRWRQLGYPPSEGWVLQALGQVGDDETVRRLAPMIRAWPAEGGHARAVAALDVLAGIGTGVALMHLNGIATKVKFKGLRDKAVEKIAEVADGLGLTAEQLADRLVPDFGLDDHGTMMLDVGAQRFTVGFDEQLKPYVVDEAGTRRAALPKGDAAAAERFAALKKDVRTASADQIRRLERAMVTGRRWPAEDFRLYLAGHPLLRHMVRRLVWSVGGGGSFRVAEDGTFADANDDAYALADDATVGVAHPIDLAPTLKGWAEVFADYEILQPFPQLGRETYTLTAGEAAANRLTRWCDRTLPTGKLLGLERRGWRRGDPQDGGVQGWFERATPNDLTLLVDLDPGIVVGEPTMFDEQRITDVWLRRPGESWWRTERSGAPFGELGPVGASELIRDLNEVTT